jgi:hypothetical protein
MGDNRRDDGRSARHDVTPSRERTIEPARDSSPNYHATGASLAALLLSLLCFGGVVLLHLVRGEISPVRQVMSEYANGSHGLIMTVVFYAFGLSSLALAFRLRRAINRPWAKNLIPVLLGLAGVSLVASGVFEVERPLVPDTLEEIIHSNASVAGFVLLIMTMLLFSVACYSDARWRPFRFKSMLLAVAATAAAVATFLTAQAGWSGAVQRFLGFAVVTWLVLTALHVRSKAYSQAR